MKTQKELVEIFKDYDGKNLYDLIEPVDGMVDIFKLDHHNIEIRCDEYIYGIDYVYALNRNFKNPIYVGYMRFGVCGVTNGIFYATDKVPR